MLATTLALAGIVVVASAELFAHTTSGNQAPFVERERLLGHASEPEPTPQSGLVFADLSAPGQVDLFGSDGTGHMRRRILETAGLLESAPDALPRGERITMALEASGSDGPVSFIGVSERYGLPVQISGGPADTDPSWSASGNAVTFASRFGDVSAVVRVSWPDMVEAPVVQLEAPDYTLAQPEYADNGRLAFVVDSEADGGELWVLGPGGQFRRLLVHPGWDDVHPAWSPDGTRLAFASGPFDPKGSQHAIWLLDFATGVAGVFHSEVEFDLDRPSWSPDGNWIAFERSVPGALQAAVHRISTSGGQAEFLTSGSAPSYVEGGLAPADAWPTLTITSTPPPGTVPPGTSTSGPPVPTLPPPPATAHMFPTPVGPEPTSTGPAPTYTIPSATASQEATTAASPRARLFLPALRQTATAPVGTP
jgi:Tol biopolymer transport system component